MGAAQVYREDFEPVRLKELVTDCGINQTELSQAVAAEMGCSVSRPTINLVINRGYKPPKLAGLRRAVEAVVGRSPMAQQWLVRNGMETKDIWEPIGKDMRMAMPVYRGLRVNRARRTPAMVPGDPLALTVKQEVEMINQEALRHFKVFRNPFIDDIQKDSDIYMSDEHRYIEAAMLDAARHGGFLAVVGEVGSGKTVMRRKVIERLKRDGDTLVVFPQTIDKTRLTAASICDAIVMDISSEKCRIKLEDKSRQVRRLLMDRAKSGYRNVLIIEEAHDLAKQTLKYLKRFSELEDGYRKLLGIILVGQPELKHSFDEATNVDMREVIRRVQIAEIRGLNGHLKNYLAVKFKRVGKRVEEIFAEDAYAALSRRLTSKARDGKQTISHAYPLLVNNYVARAMNLAYDIKEPLITADVVMSI